MSQQIISYKKALPPKTVVLDFDKSVGELPGACMLDLSDWQESIRFGTGWKNFWRLKTLLSAQLPVQHGTVFTGSGDYHHISYLLIERLAQRLPAGQCFQVVLFDNHPDNMRFPFGIHCGSWVKYVALLPQVSHVYVLGITSQDIGAAHAFENYWQPLRAGKLSYWCMDVDVGWSRYAGLSRAFHRFTNPDALIDAFLAEQDKAVSNRLPTYLSIDKDVISPEIVHTNWDQGRMLEKHLLRVIEALHGQIIGSDITGEVSVWQYRTWWKRLLSAMDGQANISAAQVNQWQQQQFVLNKRLLAAIEKSRA